MAGTLDNRPIIRNVVQLNAGSDALGFAAAMFAKTARLLRLTELGPERLAARMVVPSVVDVRIWLPDTIALSRQGGEAKALLSNLRPARIMIVHRTDSLPRLEQLIETAMPDAICLAEEVASAWTPPETPGPRGAFDPGFDLTGCGLARVRFFANKVGGVALIEALATLDAARRRRLRERERVYDVEDFVPCSGLYPNERDEWGRWAWTGPETIATFLAPMHGGERARLTLFFFANKKPIDAEHIRVLVNGRAFVTRYFPDEMKIEVNVVDLGDDSFARLDLMQAAMVPTEDHSRRLGFALHKLKIEVEP